MGADKVSQFFLYIKKPTHLNHPCFNKIQSAQDESSKFS